MGSSRLQGQGSMEEEKSPNRNYDDDEDKSPTHLRNSPTQIVDDERDQTEDPMAA